MTPMDAVYVLLIVLALSMIPLRVKARQRTVKEIEALRFALRQDIQELIEKLEPRTVTETTRRARCPDWPLFEEYVGNLLSSERKVLLERNKNVIALAKQFGVTRLEYEPLMKKRLAEPCDIYVHWLRGKTDWTIWYMQPTEEEEDVWATEEEEDVWAKTRVIGPPRIRMPYARSMA